MKIDFDFLDPDQSKLQDQLYEDMQSDFNQIIEKLYDLIKGNETKYLQSLLSRDIHQSGFVKDCANLALIDKYLKDDIEINEVIINSIRLKKIIRDRFIDLGRKVKISLSNKYSVLDFLKERTFYKYLRIFKVLQFSIMSFKSRDKDRIDEIDKKKTINYFRLFLGK